MFLIRDDDGANINQMIEAVIRDGYCIAQEYLPAAQEGDVRLFVMNGRPLKKDGKYAAFRRVNKTGDMRSNMHSGGESEPAEIDRDALRLVEMVRPKLVADGMFLVGLDIVKDKLMEINVFTPGGLGSARQPPASTSPRSSSTTSNEKCAAAATTAPASPTCRSPHCSCFRVSPGVPLLACPAVRSGYTGFPQRAPTPGYWLLAAKPRNLTGVTNTSNPHRKQIKHYDLPGHCHELTFSCYDRLPLLTNESWREQLARAIDNANDRHGWRLAAFVFMPEHVHLIVHPVEFASRIQDLLFAIKRPFSYRIKQHLVATQNPLLTQLTIRQRPDVSSFRFWQEGPGYDRNLTSGKAILASLEYLHANPIRRRLCSRSCDWRWSSSRWYLSDGQEIDPQLPRLTPLPMGIVEYGTRGTLA